MHILYVKWDLECCGIIDISRVKSFVEQFTWFCIEKV